MTDKKYTVGITTFINRLDYFTKFLSQIRSQTDADVIVVINGNYQQSFDDEYRKSILKLCLEYQNVYPIFFPEQRGLAKLVNTLCIHSTTDWTVILQDDLELTSDDFFSTIEQNLTHQHPDICRINSSFQYYAVHKDILDELGYFDERLLGFGEEDGDIIWRYVSKYNRNVTEWSIGGIQPSGNWIRDENIRPGVSKYSAFNREFMFSLDNNPKYILSGDDTGIEGMFGAKYIKVQSDATQYPYESFFRNNKNKL
jgi:glycosyltransferase involved in cell wall biosynthesis